MTYRDQSVAPPNGARFAYLPAVLVGLFALSAAVAYQQMVGFTADPDMFWHIAAGRWIVNHGTVPHTDVLSWTGQALGLPWTSQEWLFGTILYGVWRLGDFPAVYAFASCSVGAAVLAVFALARARSANPLSSLIVATASMVAMMPLMAPRPHVLSYVLVPLMAVSLERGRWWFALPVFLLGINLHGGLYPLYLVVAAYYLLLRRPWLLAAFAAATVVNPQWWDLYVYSFKALLHVSAAPVDEWKPVTLQNYPVLFLALFASTIVAARPGVPFMTRSLCLAFGVLSLLAMRHAVWFFLVPMPILTPYFAALGRSRVFPIEDVPNEDLLTSRSSGRFVGWLKGRASAAWSRIRERSATDVTPRTAGRLNGVLATSLLVLAVVLVSVAEPLDVDRHYPRQASAFLKARGDTRFYNLWNHGGYLIFQGLPPFIDGRQDPFEIRNNGRYDIIGDHVRTVYLRSDIEPVLQRYGMSAILMPLDTALVRVLRNRPGFRTAYADREFVVLDYEHLAR